MENDKLKLSVEEVEMETLSGLLDSIGFRPLGQRILIKPGVQKSPLHIRLRDERA